MIQEEDTQLENAENIFSHDDLMPPARISCREIANFTEEELISTGVPRLNELLGGGLAPGEILEVYGKSGTGKTQLCLSIAAAFCHKHIRDSTAIYFDTKNDFQALRLEQICRETPKIFDRIQVAKQNKIEDVVSLLRLLQQENSFEQLAFFDKLGLIIVDSLPALLYPAVSREYTSWRFYLELISEQLKQLASRKGLAVIVVNNAVSSFEKNEKNIYGSLPSSSASQVKPAMGKYWLHKPNCRILLSKCEHNASKYSATLEKSTRRRTGESFEFSITKNGME